VMSNAMGTGSQVKHAIAVMHIFRYVDCI